nr:zinc knuckle CX2CX4HX4C [Tanacetum cinerariifolium]
MMTCVYDDDYEFDDKFMVKDLESGLRRDETVDNEEDVLVTDAGKVDEDDSIVEDKDQSLNEAKENETVIEEEKNNSCQKNKSSKSYADVTEKNVINFDKKLLDIPSEIDSNGNEIVMFDDVMVAEGSKRWERTLCDYFVGYGMSVNELRYNLRRMWSRHGFKDIIDFNNGVYFMKFNTGEGLDFIVNKGPWMVKNKPLIVQKWDINVCLDKTEPNTIPLWVKICNVPLEAWIIKEISVLASRVGKPLVIDNVTASMCRMGIGRVGFARVLVEVTAKKPLSTGVKIVYKNGSKEEICRKAVKVFVEGVRAERSRQNVNEEKRKEKNLVKSKNDGMDDSEGFIALQKKRNGGVSERVLKPDYMPNTQHTSFVNQKGNMNRKANVQYEFQPKKKEKKTIGNSSISKEMDDVYIDDTGMAECMTNDGMEDAHTDGKEHDNDVQKSVSFDFHSSSYGDQSKEQGDKAENKDKVSAAGLNFTNNTNDFSAAGPSNAAMPNLKDLSHNADDLGAEADINNMESIILVSPIPTSRIHKDHPTSQIIGDLSSTTQTRSMARGVRDQGGI